VVSQPLFKNTTEPSEGKVVCASSESGLGVWGLVPPPTQVIYHHFGLCGEIGGHLGNCPK
jgi:hypothetical protein